MGEDGVRRHRYHSSGLWDHSNVSPVSSSNTLLAITWMAPQQIVLTGISEAQNEAVKAAEKRFFERGFRVSSDLRNEKVNAKVREYSLKKVPFIGVIGAREVENDTITVRRFGTKHQKTLGIEELMNLMDEEIRTKALPPGFGIDA